MSESILLEWVELIVTGIELLAVVIIVIAILLATASYIYGVTFQKHVKGLYRNYRRRLAKAILMGLEILIAADVIRTVALDRTTQSIVVLGLLVLVRIVLSWSLLVEMNNRWPWQPKAKADSEDEDI